MGPQITGQTCATQGLVSLEGLAGSNRKPPGEGRMHPRRWESISGARFWPRLLPPSLYGVRNKHAVVGDPNGCETGWQTCVRRRWRKAMWTELRSRTA